MKRTVITLFLLQLLFNANAQWNLIYQDSSNYAIYDAVFFNKDSGIVCGGYEHGYGFILRTYDGGITWDSTTSSIMVCTNIHFFNDTVGITGGQDAVLYKTNDGGITWSSLCMIAPYSDFSGMNFIDDNIGFVRCCDGGIFKTTNGGNTWSYLINVKPNTPYYLYDYKASPIFFVNDSIGFVCGKGIYKTTDQGNTWTSNIDTMNIYNAIYMFDENEGIAVGNNGAIIHTSDSWDTWSYDSICSEVLRDICFINDSIGYLVGGGFEANSSFGDWEQNGFIMLTTDHGNNWERIDLSSKRLNSFHYIDSVAFIVGNQGKIFKNSNYSSILKVARIDNNNLKIWPNPTNSCINIDIKLKTKPTVLIYNLSGQKVIEENNFTNNQIALDQLKAGAYIVKVITDLEIHSEKIILIKNVP